MKSMTLMHVTRAICGTLPRACNGLIYVPTSETYVYLQFCMLSLSFCILASFV